MHLLLSRKQHCFHCGNPVSLCPAWTDCVHCLVAFVPWKCPKYRSPSTSTACAIKCRQNSWSVQAEPGKNRAPPAKPVLHWERCFVSSSHWECRFHLRLSSPPAGMHSEETTLLQDATGRGCRWSVILLFCVSMCLTPARMNWPHTEWRWISALLREQALQQGILQLSGPALYRAAHRCFPQTIQLPLGC